MYWRNMDTDAHLFSRKGFLLLQLVILLTTDEKCCETDESRELDR